MQKLKYIDLFAGIGGFHYGIQNASKSGRQRQTSNEHDELESDITSKCTEQSTATCVYSNEWDKYANSVYRRHYGECDNRDIRTVGADEIPDHDLLVGGFPCQAFSIAGKRRGFDDTRGTLFFDIARILKEKQPRLCLLENVKGLLSHDNGRTIKTIFATLVELGYDLQWQVCNSKDFGVPQNRERIFIVGHLRGTPRPQVFPIGENDGISIERQRKISPTITQRYYKQGQSDPYIVTEKPKSSKQGVQQERDKPDSTDIGRGKAHTTSPLRWVRTEKGKEYRRNAQKQGKDLTPFNDGYRELIESKEPISGTITGALAKDALLKQDMKIRRLTPTECERLQGFPDGWTKYGADGELISDTQRYKMCGNAVTTNVITAIVKKLCQE